MFVYQEHTGGVSIEGCTQVSTGFTDFVLQIYHVLWFNRAGRVIGETAIQFKIKRNERAG